MGNTDSAATVFGRFLEYNTHRPESYLKVSQTYLANGYYAEATENYLAGRGRLGDSVLFALELGQLYLRQRQFYNAALEFFNYAAADTANARTGASQIDYLIENADEPAQIKDAFRDLIKKGPHNHLAYRFYADVFMKEGELDSAFENYKMVDKLDRRDGEYLLLFSNRCLEQQEFVMAARVSRYLLDKYSDRPLAWMAQVNLGKVYNLIGKPDSAVLIYHDLVRRGQERSRLEGLYLLACTFLQKLYQTDSARFYFRELLTCDRLRVWKDRVNMRIADSYLVDNRLELADSLYLEINTGRLEQAEKEELLYRRAQIQFFQKEYSDARGLYNLLVGVHPRSLFVNDCLKKMLIIDENQGMGVIDLDLYAEAERLLWQNRADSGLALLISLSQRGSSNLSALATFQAGEVFYQKQDFQRAFEFFSRILTDFESSFYGAESQRYLGDLYFYHFNDREKAREAYRLILENYPNRLLYEYARRQLRRLESS